MVYLMKIMWFDQKLQNSNWRFADISQPIRSIRVQTELCVLQVAVNGAHLLEYKHRVELERVDTINISGTVKVDAVGVLPPSSVSLCLTSHSKNKFLDFFLFFLNSCDKTCDELFLLFCFSDFSFSCGESEQPGVRDERKDLNTCDSSQTLKQLIHEFFILSDEQEASC